MIEYIDGYKLDHRRQYPDKTEYVYSNWTPRSSRIPGSEKVVFFGLQYFLKKYLDDAAMNEIFCRNSLRLTEGYADLVNSYLGPNTVGTKHIDELWELGHIPLRFKALPEGTLVPLGVPMFTVENTDPRFFWLPNYIETILSNIIWLPCTSATTAYRYRRLLDNWADYTGGDRSFVPWQGHDFSFRGMSGLEAACMSGAAHLLSFYGSDTIPAIRFIENYYGCEGTKAGSVTATEHSVMCAGGKESEIETFRRLLKLYPSGVLSIVSDTWDLWNVITNILPQLKEEILARDGKLVIRPDSGDPVKIICGDPDSRREDARKGVIQLLWDVFGGSKNKEGFKELNPKIGAIYGDSITIERAGEICLRLANQNYASTNIVLGIGSFTYQYVTRDTYGFAMKATHATIDGIGYDLFKKPVTDDGSKFSAKGRLSVIMGDSELKLIQGEERSDSLLETVWENGKFKKTYSFDQIRNNLHGEVK